MSNLLLNTDVYKFGHLYQYPKGTTKVYSYLQARKPNREIVFYGLQYYLSNFLTSPVTKENVDEFIEIVTSILGPDKVERKHYDALVELGYIPLEIRAVEEGSVIPSQNVLMTITNTHPDFAWLVGYVESLLLKVWNTCTVASNSRELRNVCLKYAKETCDNIEHLPFQIHDFGYRGCSSEETSALSGSAHLLSFLGTDTVPAVSLINKYYNKNKIWPIGLSVPATEHSVMCAYGRDNEITAYKQMLTTYPTGIVSIVSDTYNLWNVLTNFTDELYSEIVNREGKVVFRPDSGNPHNIICGDVEYPEGSPENLGAMRLLWDKFGGTVNSKGFKILNPKVGLIYGDGITPKVMVGILQQLQDMKFASSNIVFGVGGLLLQNFNRDTLGFAIKATQIVINGNELAIQKDPITDTGKKSHTGYLALRQADNDEYYTVDGLSKEAETNTLLSLVYRNGKIIRETSIEEIRSKVQR